MTTSERGPEPLVTGPGVGGTEALAKALRRAVARGQAAADARQMQRLAALARTGRDPAPAGPVPALTTVRRYRIAEVTVAFEAVVRRDPGAEGGLAFVAAAPARASSATRRWPSRVLDALFGRRFAPVTITIRPDADAEAVGTQPKRGWNDDLEPQYESARSRRPATIPGRRPNKSR